jgi:hypothetical protein
MKMQDQREFEAYLRGCTNRQVQGVYDKEQQAGRQDYALLARLEAAKRNLRLEDA